MDYLNKSKDRVLPLADGNYAPNSTFPEPTSVDDHGGLLSTTYEGRFFEYSISICCHSLSNLRGPQGLSRTALWTSSRS